MKFFEAGKTYRSQEVPLTFEPVRVDADGDGRPIAYGRLTHENGEFNWAAFHRLGGFHRWTEVTEGD